MKSEKTGHALTIHLSQDEVFELQAGNVVGDRPGVTIPDAKVNVLPLSAKEPDNSLEDQWSIDRREKGLSAPLKARLDTDGDLAVFVPAIKLSDVRISGASIARDLIETPGVKDEAREKFLRHAIPDKGVIVSFSGSLKVIEIGPAAHY